MPALASLLLACGGPTAPDAGPSDAAAGDAGRNDAGSGDAGSSDAGSSDAGSSDAGSSDAGPGLGLTLELTFTVRLDPAVSAFEPLTGREARCTIELRDVEVRGGAPMRVYAAASTGVACAPDPPEITSRMAANLDGQPATVTVFGGPGAAAHPTRLTITGREGGAEVFTLEDTCDASVPVDGGEPSLPGARCDAGTVSLARYRATVTPGSLLDQAEASSQWVAGL